MESGEIRCPKCMHEQIGGTECEACGVIFARYETILARKAKAIVEERSKEEVSQPEKSGKGKGLVVTLQIVLLVILTAVVTYYFTRPHSSQESASQVADTASGQPESRQTAGLPETDTPQRAPAGSTMVQQAEPTADRGGSIEQARKATVSIETPWGTGSGFFINDNYIVTNRHVIEIDQVQLAEFRRKVEATRELVELEKQKLRDYKAQMKRLPQGAARSQLQIIIEESERELKKVLPKLQEAEERLASMEERLQPSDIRIILADGSGHAANYLMTSEEHDLAILSLYIKDTAYLKRAPKSVSIRQGDRVFTIGSPVGLRNTVTAGVFSGYRKDTDSGKVYLQTDAPINPGNSGGPLIDERGYVHGVNTMILQNTEGIGFAIPIDTVFEEFGSSIH